MRFFVWGFFCWKKLNFSDMKKQYLTPDVRFAPVCFEESFLASRRPGYMTGEDLDDPEQFDPWS